MSINVIYDNNKKSEVFSCKILFLGDIELGFIIFYILFFYDDIVKICFEWWISMYVFFFGVLLFLFFMLVFFIEILSVIKSLFR